MTGDLDLATRILREACGDRVRIGLPMAPLTTFRIGGPAAIYLEPDAERDLAAAAAAIVRAGVPFVVLGKGSNVLVDDAGFPGIVLRLGKGFRWTARDGHTITAGAAMPLPALAGVASRHGLDGLAFAVAIPASLGGAVRMNAGAHGGEIAEVVTSVDVFSLIDGERRTIGADEAGFAYRRSALPADAVVVGARFALTPGDPVTIRAAMDEARRWRRDTQPIAEPNCGSVFTNPPDAHAAALIDAAGLKGTRVGHAVVSMKHANFIVAEPGARASDVRALIELVRSRVAADSGVWLEPEVRVIGGDHAA